MKSTHLLSLAIAVAVAAPSTLTLAAQDDEHAGHHPAPAASAPGAKAVPGKPAADMARMDTQMKAMAQMHEKMQAATTPAERNALMAEHMKSMQEGMTMINGMSSGGMGNMAMRQQMMESTWP